MIFFALLLAASAADVPPVAQAVAPEAEDIVVLARKLKFVRVKMALSKKDGDFGVKSCKVSRASGDTEIDALACQAPQYCTTLNLKSQDAFVECVKSRGREQIRAVAEQRSLKRDAQ